MTAQQTASQPQSEPRSGTRRNRPGQPGSRMTTTSPASSGTDLADRILKQQILGRPGMVSAMLRQLSSDDTEEAIRSWCDSLLEPLVPLRAEGPAPDSGQAIFAIPVWVDGTGRRTTSVSPAMNWVGEVIFARSIFNYRAYMKLVSALPQDPDQRHDWLRALVSACASARTETRP